MEEWDVDLSMTKEDFGISTDNLRVTGVGKLAEGATFNFKAPISAFKLQYALGKK